MGSYLIHLISTRFNISDSLSEAFLYLPESLGGLGLHNPFIPLLLVSQGLDESPQKSMKQFYANERSDYNYIRQNYEEADEFSRRKHYNSVFREFSRENNNDNDGGGSGSGGDKAVRGLAWSETKTFPSFEEYAKLREVRSAAFKNTYEHLLSQPYKNEIRPSSSVTEALKRISRGIDTANSNGSNGVDPKHMAAEVMWAVNFYADEAFEKYGDLAIVNRSLLPLGVLAAMRDRRVTWQMPL